MVYLLIICYLIVVAGFAKALLVAMNRKYGDEAGFGSKAYCAIIAALWPLVAVILGVVSLFKDSDTIANFLYAKKG